MIRIFLLLLLSLAGSWFVADTIRQKGAGYAYIYFNQYSIETSFWAFMAAIAIIVIALYLLLRSGTYATRLIVKTGRLSQNLGQNKSRKLHQTAVLAYLEGYWHKSYRDMTKALKKVETPFIANLLIMQAALKRADITVAEQAYKEAENSEDYDELTLMLASIDLQLAKHEGDDAEKLITVLLREYPFEMRVVLKALRIYQQNGNVEAMEPLIKTAKKHHLLTALEVRTWQLGFFHKKIQDCTVKEDWAALKKVWRKAYKLNDQNLQSCFFLAALKLADSPELEKRLLKALKKHYSAELVLIYAKNADNDFTVKIEFVTGFLSQHRDDAILFAALALLSSKNEQPEKAIEYLQKSLKINESPAAWQQLAAVYAQSNQTPEQLECLQKALDLMQG